MNPRSLVPWWRSEGGVAERDPFAALQKEMNELLENFLGPRADRALGGFSPKVDVAETETEVKVTAELPGMEEKDIDISVDGDMLTIKGEKKTEKEEKKEESYRLERSYGSFRRDILLPSKVQMDKVKATFAKGVLTVMLPKSAEAAKRRKIKLEAV